MSQVMAAAAVSEESQHRLRSPVKKRPRLQSPVHKSRVEVSKEAPGFVKSKVLQEEKAPVVEKWKKGNQERWIEGDWFCQRCGNHNFHWKGFHYNLNGDLSMQLATLQPWGPFVQSSAFDRNPVE